MKCKKFFVLLSIFSLCGCNFLGFLKTQNKEEENEETTNNEQNSNKEEEEIFSNEFTLENVKKAYINTISQSKYTTSYKSEYEMILNENNTESYSYSAKEFTLMIDGEKMHVTYTPHYVERGVSIQSVIDDTNLSREEVISDFIEGRNNIFAHMYGLSHSRRIDYDKELLIDIDSYGSRYEEYFVLDKDANQFYYIDEYLHNSHYISGTPFDEADIINYVNLLDNSYIQNNKLYARIDEELYEVIVDFNKNVVSKLVLSINENNDKEKIEFTFTDIGSTSIDLKNSIKPQCPFTHNEDTYFDYKTTSTGHRKVCMHCGKFLGPEEPHSALHNPHGVCEICGYVPNEELNLSHGVDGFENNNEESLYKYYLYVYESGGVYFNVNFGFTNGTQYESTEPKDYDFDVYYVFENDNVILSANYGEYTEVENTCFTRCLDTYKLYRNVPSSTIDSINDAAQNSNNDAYLLIQNYLKTRQADASTSGFRYSLTNHNNGEYQTYKLNDCYSYKEYRCSDCGFVDCDLIIDNNIHFENYTIIDQYNLNDCDTEMICECNSCHEIYFDGFGNHNSDGKREVYLDPCHKMIFSYCTKCGEEFSETEFIQEHVGTTITKEITRADSSVVELTICESCNLILSKNLITPTPTP